MLQPSPAAPSGSALQSLKVISACPRVGSRLARLFTSTPPSLRSTINKEMSPSRPLDPVRAATTAKSAIAPSATGFLTPLSIPLAAVSLTFFGDGLPFLEQRQRSDRLARGNRRQPFLLLRVAARDQQRFGCEIDGG